MAESSEEKKRRGAAMWARVGALIAERGLVEREVSAVAWGNPTGISRARVSSSIPLGDRLEQLADALGVTTAWLLHGTEPRERVSSERTVELDGEIDPVIARVAEGRGYSEQVLRQASAGRGAYGTNFTEQAAMELLEITARYEREVVRSARLAELEAATERAPLPKVRVGTEVEEDDAELARKRAALRAKKR